VSRPDPARFAAARAHFEELVELDPAVRAERLSRLAAADPELERAVVALLEADRAAGEFLSTPVAASARTLVDEWVDSGAPAEAGRTVGPWRLLAPLGRGGMGEVWEVERIDGQFEQRAALKLLRPGMDSDEIVARFLRERQILARLVHPGIARLLDGGRAADGRPYLVLEKVDGATVTEHSRAAGLGIDERVRLIAEACDAVESAHRQLVVHRDLKPSNILVTREGRVQLLDFGIAKLLDDTGGETALTRTGLGALTPAYAAPEQILGEPVTTATDVYALGVVLYELLVGSLPHRRSARTAAGLASEITRETVPRPSTQARRGAAAGADARERRRLERRLRGDLDTILLKALAREPERRYASAAALGDDLRRFLAGRPVVARPDTAAYRTGKFVRRHWVGVASAALVVLSLAGGLIAAAWQARRAEASSRAAAAEARRAERTKEFLISLFEVADPTKSGGETVTARQLLEQGATRLEAELASEPELRADLLEAIGRIEASLGLLDAAERSVGTALELRAGAPPAARASAEATLGSIRIQRGELDPAAELLEGALAALERSGAPPLAIARVRSDAAQVRFWRKEVAAAEREERAVYETFRAELGADHVETAIHLRNVGVILDDLQRFDEAEAAYRESQRILAASLGPDHPNLSQSYMSLGILLANRGRFEEGEPLVLRALAMRRRIFGDRHLQTGQTLQNYAHLLVGAGRLDDAEAAGREALGIFRALNPDHFEVGKCLNGLGIVAAKRGDHARAETIYRESLANFERSLGRDHPFYWWTTGNLSKEIAAQGRLAEAEALQAEILAALERISGPESADAQWGHEIIADRLRLEGRTAEADAAAARARAIAAKLAAAS
jgi:serine/threonine-protein kinase